MLTSKESGNVSDDNTQTIGATSTFSNTVTDAAQPKGSIVPFADAQLEGSSKVWTAEGRAIMKDSMVSRPNDRTDLKNATITSPLNLQPMLIHGASVTDGARSAAAATVAASAPDGDVHGVDIARSVGGDTDGGSCRLVTPQTSLHNLCTTGSPTAAAADAAIITVRPVGPPATTATFPTAIFSAAAGRRQDPLTCGRISGFLMLHFASFTAQVGAMANFLYTQDYGFFMMTLCPFLFSGLFCTYVAWHCDAPRCCPGVLPLKSRSRPVACFLAVPFGFGQIVIVLLAVEEYLTQKDGSAALPTSQEPVRPYVNRFHLKAVNGLFEGLFSCAILLYAFWSMNYPPEDPITERIWWGENTLLAVFGLIQFVSSGLGLLEMDYCTSRTIYKRMRRSIIYEAGHWFFRITEVISRCSIFMGFMVFTSRFVFWWWFPLAVDILVTFWLVSYFGGAEKNGLVRLLCSVPCTFANVFAFIDSPYKHRAAMRLSKWLTVKHGIELLVLPLLAFAARGFSVFQEARCFWKLHEASTVICAIAIVLYWPLLWYMKSASMHLNNMVDIYTACETDSVSTVRKVMREMTQSAAIGLRIDAVDIDGYTPLMCAALRGNAKVCRLLLQEGAKVSIQMGGDSFFFRKLCVKQVKRRWTALHMAAWKGHAEVLRVLLDGVGRILSEAADDTYDFRDAMGDTPLHVAAWRGHKDVVQLLMQYRPDWPKTVNNCEQRPVDVALGTRAEEARQLLEAADLLGVDTVLEDGGGAARRLAPPLLLNHDRWPNFEHQNQAWPQFQLSIRRSAPREGKLMAPGLCSYIASSCGGALGRIFLADASLRSNHDAAMLSQISEGTGRECDDSVLASLKASTENGFPSAVQSWTPQIDATDIGLAMDDLEPIDEYGEPPRWWRQMAERLNQEATASSQSSGEKFMHVPEVAKIGEGSYGVVWRAKSRLSTTWYAVKNIKTPSRMESSVATRECEVADHVRLKPHPCIIKLHHVYNFTDCGLYVLVMEYASGGTLLSRMQSIKVACSRNRQRYQPPVEKMGWISQVFLGLEHMHIRMDTLLRDLKPENVVITKEGRAKLTDFGFGRFGVESTNQFWSFGIPTGSPGYVAPEVLRCTGHGSACDLYSLGVLVWVMLTGGFRFSPDVDEDVLPPLRNPQDGTIAARLHDWKLLAQCVAKPEEGQRLPEDVRDFVAHLTVFEPRKRFSHGQIRSHRFMESCQLPPYEAGPSAVEAWLATWVQQIQSQRAG